MKLLANSALPAPEKRISAICGPDCRGNELRRDFCPIYQNTQGAICRSGPAAGPVGKGIFRKSLAPMLGRQHWLGGSSFCFDIATKRRHSWHWQTSASSSTIYLLSPTNSSPQEAIIRDD